MKESVSMSDKKTVRRDGVEPTTPTLINVVRGYLTMYSSKDPGPGLSMYTSEREFTLVLLDCCARVTEAQTINELRTALGDIVGALGLFLINGTDRYNHNTDDLQAGIMYITGARAHSQPFGYAPNTLADMIARQIRHHLSNYLRQMGEKVTIRNQAWDVDPVAVLEQFLSWMVYLLAVLEEMYPPDQP